MSGKINNTTYALQANALALRDIVPLGHTIVYAENIRRTGLIIYKQVI